MDEDNIISDSELIPFPPEEDRGGGSGGGGGGGGRTVQFLAPSLANCPRDAFVLKFHVLFAYANKTVLANRLAVPNQDPSTPVEEHNVGKTGELLRILKATNEPRSNSIIIIATDCVHVVSLPAWMCPFPIR